MLKNYFKIAIAVLKRRKFFTFISLFGISITLTILMVGTAFLDQTIRADYPEAKRDRSLYISSMQMSNTEKGWINRSSLSIHFLENYASSLKNIEALAIISYEKSVNAYVNDKKIELGIRFTNADLWKIMDFKFLEGKPYTSTQLKNKDAVAVISETTKKAYFGDARLVMGKFIKVDNIDYKVIGVVKDVNKLNGNVSGDMYIPYTLSKQDYSYKDLLGDYNGILLAKDAAGLPELQQQYQQMVSKVPIENKEFDQLVSYADSFMENLTRSAARTSDAHDNGMRKVLITLGSMVFLFLLLPTINLVNINMTRIMERASEIGVRKAFGASSATLVYQFIVENVILTLLGGIFGIIFSVLLMYFLNSSDIFPGMALSINPLVLFYSLLICLVFGFLSGVYPAWRMSRLNIVAALKA
ncbi:ABC transporter permease [Pedobacter antarcticus]|uniref:ABC transporter permease n=1 Tax=Pedobacter antarcticus TaxID=34086 RepID=UPI0029313A3F|nr:ABC transporter permease [Pedobacter antarcticus]